MTHRKFEWELKMHKHDQEKQQTQFSRNV